LSKGRVSENNGVKKRFPYKSENPPYGSAKEELDALHNALQEIL
jgi:hypothetical protein